MSRASPPPPADHADDVPAGGLATAEQADPLTIARTPPLRILVAGADGFLGSHLVPRLESRGHLVRAMTHGGVGPGREAAPGLDWREADITRPETLQGLAHECDAVVHLAGVASDSAAGTVEAVNATGTRHLLQEATRSRVRRFVYLSALGASPTGSPFFRSKFNAEDAVMSSGLEYVILRPSVVYGPGDHFTHGIVSILRASPLFPMLGDGTFQLQPVAVEDVTDAVTQSIERADVAGSIFELAGPDRLSFTRIVRIVGETIGARRIIVPLPEQLASPAVWLASRIGLPMPFTPAQLDVLRWGNVLGSGENPLRAVFRVKPLPFRDAVVDYLGPTAFREPRTGRGEEVR